MGRRGFFAEIAHQAKVAERERLSSLRSAQREYDAALRRQERARKADERAHAKMLRAVEADRKNAEKTAKKAHLDSMLATVESLNFKLECLNSDLESLLAATLDVDDFVDLETLRRVVVHPAFDRADLKVPIIPPEPIAKPAEPEFIPPLKPSGLFSFLKRKAYVEELEQSQRGHEESLEKWRVDCDAIDQADRDSLKRHAEKQRQRVAQLELEQKRYQRECEQRGVGVAAQNEALDTLIANLSYGVAEAVEEYISIVLANSVYPTHFAVEHDFKFLPEEAELRLAVSIPAPAEMSDVKVHRYVKAKDEITHTLLSQKARRDQYTSSVHQVALRSLHEVFEADRRGLIRSISLEVGTQAPNPATGIEGFIPFVLTAAEREAFLQIDLANVIPSATLEHIGATLSTNPLALKAARRKGVRRA